MRRLILFFAVSAFAFGQERAPFQADLQNEYDFYVKRLLALAKAIPEEKYSWRPAEDVRSIGEVILHVAFNNYMLLDLMGREIPGELYPRIPATGAGAAGGDLHQEFRLGEGVYE